MTAPSYRHRYTYEEYLAYEDGANTKHEFLDGVIFGIAGGSPEHGAIAMNMAGALVLQLRETRARSSRPTCGSGSSQPGS
jgi:hypothetical protein